MQRVDVIADGRTVNSNQRSDNPDLWLRVKRLMQTAERIEIRRHVTPAPTPAPPPVVVPPAALGRFAEPGVWLSAEMRSNGWPAAEVARRAKAVGVKWAALDIAVNATGDYNLNAYPDLSRECTKAGITLGCWGHIPKAIIAANRVHLASAPFYIVNREAPDQTEDGFLDELRRLCAGVELAVVAGPFDAFPNPLVDKAGWEAETKPWLDLPMLVEAYTGENPQATPEAQVFQAWQRGFRKIAVVVESNETHGWTLDEIGLADVRRIVGRAVSLYMLGTARDADLDKFTRMAA